MKLSRPFVVLAGLWSGFAILPGAGEAADCVRWVLRTDVGAPEARAGHVMAYDTDRGRTVMFGGHRLDEDGINLVYLRDTWEYDGNAWQPIIIDGPSPWWRTGAAMCYDSARREMVLVGGYNDHEDQDDGYFKDTWVYRPTQPGRGVWIRKRDIDDPSVQRPARAGHALVFDTRRNVVVAFGGTTGKNSAVAAPDTYRTWEILHWHGEQWTRSSTILFGPRRFGQTWYEGPTYHAMVYDSDTGIISVSGGSYYYYLGEYDEWRDNDWSELLTINVWSGDNHRYATPVEKQPLGGSTVGNRRFHAAAYDSHRKTVVIFGGTLGAEDPPANPEDPGARLDQAVYTSFSSGGFVYGASRLNIPTPPARELHAMVYDIRRKCVVLFGGSRGLPNVYSDTWEYGLGAIPVSYVDKRNSGPQNGSLAQPFQTVRQAAAAADPACRTIFSVHAGDYPEGALTIAKPVRLLARNGPVRLH